MATGSINHAYVIKPPENPKEWVLESFHITEQFLGWCPDKDMETPILSPIPHPLYLLICILCGICYNRLLNIIASLSFMSHFQKLIDPKRVWGACD
jgi:hypothetical protein